MRINRLLLTFLQLAFVLGFHAAGETQEQDWTHFVRIAGHSVNLQNTDDIIAKATETHVFGIEIDNSLTGIYESFIDPAEKLAAIKKAADAAHAVNNYSFVYTEGLECITNQADKKTNTFFKDHPDWVQRDLDNRPAVFGGGTAFWISEGDEDVWITPYASEWRTLYMQRIRQIAETGIDGIFIDIPYWMTHFDGWEDTWASFDDYTVAEFEDRTGLDARSAFVAGDFGDPNFIKWVDFRIQSLTEFMADVNRNAKSVNPDCKVIAEIYPGIDESAVRVGADIYEMYDVVDVVAHEFSGGGGNAATKDPSDWFSRMVGMYTFRAFAEEKPSWMLSYSWSQEQDQIKRGDAMQNLALSNVMAGANCWDAAGHVMSRSNDYDTRKVVFKWIAQHEKKFYSAREPMDPIGVYFSPKSRNYFPDDFIKSYQGMMYLLLQSHLEFQVVTPRTLSGFSGDILILPDVKCLNSTEVEMLKNHYQYGVKLYITGETGQYDDSRKALPVNPLFQSIGRARSGQKTEKLIYHAACPGEAYYKKVHDRFDEFAWTGTTDGNAFDDKRLQFLKEIMQSFKYQQPVKVTASPFVTAQIAQVNGKPNVFIANFKGLNGRTNANQMPEENVEISFPAGSGSQIMVLPFLGSVQGINSEVRNGKRTATLPAITRGMVVWSE